MQSKSGIVIFFTGLSGAGKTTIATLLVKKLNEEYKLPVTFLDGDFIRKNLSSELGYSKKDRDRNVERVGFVAREIARHKGVAVCALIAPYNEARKNVRTMVEKYGTFIEVYVSTSLEVCEARDPKGNYKNARAGKIMQFTGIDDPYEKPKNPEIIIDTVGATPQECTQRVTDYIVKKVLLETN